MAQALPWTRLVDNARQVIEDRASHARHLVAQVMAQGQYTTREVSVALEALVQRSRRRGADLRDTGRAAVAGQLDVFDRVTNRVFAALSYRLFGDRDGPRSP